MNSKHVKGLQVISIPDGKQVGKVEHVYLDRSARRITGFGIVEHGGLLSTRPEETLLVDADEVHSLGADTMTLDSAAPTQGAQTSGRFGDLLPIDRLAHRRVVTESGTAVGSVDSVDFDETSYQLTAIEVSPGLFKSAKRVTVDQVVSIGEDVVLVLYEVAPPEVAAPPAEAAPMAEGGGSDASASAFPSVPPTPAPPPRESESGLVIGDIDPPPPHPHSDPPRRIPG